MPRKVVALDGWCVPIPSDLFSPDEYSLTTYNKRIETREEVCDAVRDANVVAVTLTVLDAHVLSAANTPNLELVVGISAGTDNIDLEACKARGIRVLNSPDSNTQSVAEHALALFLATRRSIPRIQHHVFTSQQWTETGSLTNKLNLPSGGKPASLQNETVGIMGFGAVGQAIAQLCRNLGMTVLVASRKSADAEMNGAGGDRTPFQDVLQRATAIFVCVPRNAETLGLISTDELRAMSTASVLINVSRGGVVDEAALLQALRDGEIAGSATDVFVTEPSNAGQHWKEGDTPLLQLSAEEAHALNLVVTPHVAWYTQDTFQSYISTFKNNVESWVAGEEKYIVV